MRKLILFILVVLNVHSSVIINEKTSDLDILPSSFIYEDHTGILTIKDIQKMTTSFKKVTKSRLSFGYSPDFNVWLRFTLHNKSDKKIDKIIEYANPLTTHIDFFDISTKSIYKDGLFQINKNRKTVNPYFEIFLEPNETKTYYIKVSSSITTLIIDLKLRSTQEFYNKELEHQSVLQLFFGAMLILAFYNIFIYFFIRDVSYLFYVLYIFGVVIHHLVYTGLADIYLLNQNLIIFSVELAALISSFPVIVLGLFLKSFLQIKYNYPKINKVLNILLIFVILSIVVFISTDSFNQYRSFPSIVLIVYLLFITIYTVIKKNRQAYFILGGWLIIFSAIIFMYLNSLGVFNIYEYMRYFIEIAFVSEALLFSIALADKINQLQYEKNNLDKELIEHQETEKERLVMKVENKTYELKNALQTQTTLLKELNHRVKNNMQTIISLVRLQADEVDDEDIQNIFITIQNRINAMSHLHELLYKQSDISHVNVHEYFDNLITGLQDSYENEIEIYYDINIDLEVESAISCGLILNELVTNSFKYGFLNEQGHIWITLYKKENSFYLTIEDDGVGYNTNQTKYSFGLILVRTLVEDHLQGDIITTTTNGVKNQIIWRENG